MHEVEETFELVEDAEKRKIRDADEKYASFYLSLSLSLYVYIYIIVFLSRSLLSIK
tara:strand:- start:84 stop:251 length:168 start_codon:yes stop_codon:yes gene_type:complete